MEEEKKKPTIAELEEVIGSVEILPDGTVKPIEPPKFIEPPGVTKVKIEVLEDLIAEAAAEERRQGRQAHDHPAQEEDPED